MKANKRGACINSFISMLFALDSLSHSSSFGGMCHINSFGLANMLGSPILEKIVILDARLNFRALGLVVSKSIRKKKKSLKDIWML